MKRCPLKSAQVFHLAGLTRIIFLFLIWPLTTTCFGAAAPSSNTVPWSDDFENQYSDLTPLIGGTNGWYGSSNNNVYPLVQTNIIRSGTKAALIPVDSTLSNRFQSEAPTNVWIQMDVRPSVFDGVTNYNGTNYTIYPAVDTNAAILFYLNTNGNFVVLNGPETNGAFNQSTNWVVATNLTVATNGATWVRINIYQDFENKKWHLYADGVLATNNIGFITNLTNFAGFDIYNGAATTYLDNVSVIKSDTNVAPPLIVVPSALSTSVFAGITPSVTPNNQIVKVINVWSGSVGFQVRTNSFWGPVGETNRLVAANETNELVLTHVDTATWTPGVSNTEIQVISTNGTDYWGTQTVQVTVNMIALSNVMYVTPLQLSNDVWRGSAPLTNTVEVRNQSDLSFKYAVVTGAEGWVTSSPTGGTLAAWSTGTLTLSYRDTADWDVGLSNTWVDVVATNGEVSGVLATQRVNVALNLKDFIGVMQVAPVYISNTVWRGDTPTSRTFQVWNTGDFSFVYGVTTGAAGGWITCSPTGGTLAAWSTSTVTLTYNRSTWGWLIGTTSNATATVTSANGFGVTSNVFVYVNVDPAATNYYAATNGNNTSPYTNWDMAATNLTLVVDKANFYQITNSVVWVSNGGYNLTAQVTISNLTVRSVNGAESVTVNGRNAMRGFYLRHSNSVLNGFTITNCNAAAATGAGQRMTNGGAIFVDTGLVWNCRIMGNNATNGGGVAVGKLGVVRNCLIWGNTATNGGGVFYVGSGLVESCTIASNYAVLNGGGLYTSNSTTGLCVNTVVYQNTAGGAGGYSNWGTNVTAKMNFTNSCVSPTVEVAGLNNIDANPGFINVSAGNCQLSNSSCFNMGTNQAWMVNAFDLAGNMRIRFGRVDIGAYEWVPYPPGLKINGVPYGQIKFINGAEPRRINDIPAAP